MSIAIGQGGAGGGGPAAFADITGSPSDNANLAAALALELDVLQPEGTIASAATTDLATITSEQISVTGTTTITSFGNGAAGTRKYLRFGGILQITYNATSMILPGTTSITTAVNDRAMFLSLGGGNWICLWYQRANGQFVIPSVNAGQAQDITNVTYNGDGSIATYAMNGYTWTMAYNANGTPNTETSGSLVKTYNYNGSGQFTGITGAINAGGTKICTIATLPTAANSAPGDVVFVTDINQVYANGGSLGNLGQLFKFVGATGTGYWMPAGACGIDSKIGTIASPLATLSGTLGATTNFSVGVACPGGWLKPGMRLKGRFHIRKSGTDADAQIFLKIGQANTTSDTSHRVVTFNATDGTNTMIEYEIFIDSTTTAHVTSFIGNQAGEADTLVTSLTGLNLANPLYVNGTMTTNLTTPSAGQLISCSIDFVG